MPSEVSCAIRLDPVRHLSGLALLVLHTGRDRCRPSEVHQLLCARFLVGGKVRILALGLRESMDGVW